MHSSVKRFFSPGRLLAMIALLFAAGTAIIRCTGSGRIVKASAPAQRAHTLVIDAGHGGLDGGAVSVYGDRESAINLSIAKRLYGLCRLCGAECIMTRYDEDLPYPQDADSVRAKKRWDLENRVELCNSTDGAILVSIHQNRYPDARPSGTQVLYAQTDGSAVFAALTHENLSSALCPANRRVASPAADAIYLLKHAQCPAILVECGFLSNPTEAQLLTDSVYQSKLAVVLCASYFQFIAPIT